MLISDESCTGEAAVGDTPSGNEVGSNCSEAGDEDDWVDESSSSSESDASESDDTSDSDIDDGRDDSNNADDSKDPSQQLV